MRTFVAPVVRTGFSRPLLQTATYRQPDTDCNTTWGENPMLSATTRLGDVTDEELDDARAAGEQAAEQAREAISRGAPAEPPLRLAWAVGFGQVGAIDEAVAIARQAGMSWRQIGEIMGEN